MPSSPDAFETPDFLKDWKPAELQPRFDPLVREASGAGQEIRWESFTPLEEICQPEKAAPAAASAPAAPRSAAQHALDWNPEELAYSIPALSFAAAPAQPDPDWQAEQMAEIEAALTAANQRLQDAEQALHDAQSQAAEMLSSAAAQAAEMIRQAQAQAAQERAEAQAAGRAAAEAETANLVQAAKTVVNEVSIWREQLLTQGEMMMLRLVIEIAQALFGAGVPLDPDTLGQAFTRAISEARTLGDLRIHVHPEDAALIGPHWARQQEALSGQVIELVPSDLVKRGGCFVEGQFGSVDARIETQLQLVEETLLRTLEVDQHHPAEDAQ